MFGKKVFAIGLGTSVFSVFMFNRYKKKPEPEIESDSETESETYEETDVYVQNYLREVDTRIDGLTKLFEDNFRKIEIRLSQLENGYDSPE